MSTQTTNETQAAVKASQVERGAMRAATRAATKAHLAWMAFDTVYAAHSAALDIINANLEAEAARRA